MRIIHTAVSHDQAVGVTVTAIGISRPVHSGSEHKTSVVLPTATHVGLSATSWISVIPLWPTFVQTDAAQQKQQPSAQHHFKVKVCRNSTHQKVYNFFFPDGKLRSGGAFNGVRALFG